MKHAINPCIACPAPPKFGSRMAAPSSRDTPKGMSNGKLVTRKDVSPPLTVLVMGHKSVEEKGRVKKKKTLKEKRSEDTDEEYA